MKNLALIPDRGGSKRIPRKNIKEFNGKPIIAYSIEAALNSGLFDEVMVSTDDKEIAEVAKKYGASVPFLRSKKNSDDFATTYEVLKEVIDAFSEIEKYFDNICCIYPCAPFVTKEKLKLTFEKLKLGNFDTVIPIVPFSFPIQRSFVAKNNKLSYKFPEFEKSRSQDLEKIYHDAGQFYWCKKDSLLSHQSLINYNTGFLELPELEVQDIDNEVDWELAELKFKIYNNNGI